MRRSPAAVLLVVIGSWFAVAAAEEPPLLTAPEQAVGDGVTPVTIRLRGGSGGSPRPEDLQVEVSAGKVGKIVVGEGGALAIEYQPPRVAERIEARISVRVRRGARLEPPPLRLAVVPPATTGEELRSGGDLDLRGPRRVILGSDASAQLRFRRPPGGAPSVVTSAGRITSVHELPDGSLEATYVPPSAKVPHVALIAVTSDDGSRYDWLAIPLYGQLRMSVQSRPWVSVLVRVGETDFGPVRADDKGRATLTVLAPPGLDSATTIATDRSGNVTRATVPLDVPPSNRLLVTCAGDRLRLFAVGADGRAGDGGKLELSAQGGTLAPPVSPAPGVHEARFEPSRAVGKTTDATLRARLRGQPESSGSCRLPLREARRARLDLSLDRATFRAGDGGPIVITVERRGMSRRPGELALTADVGVIGAVSELPGERVTATWTLPDRLPPTTSRATVTAQLAGVSAQAVVELRAGPIAVLDVDRPPPTPPLGAGATLTLAGRARDRFGNPAPVSRLVARARGTATLSIDAGGGFAIHYRAPTAPRGASDTIIITDEESRTEGSVDVALQGRGRRRLGLAVRGGVLTNFARVTGPLLVADVEVRLPFWRQNLSLGLTAAVYGSSDRRAGSGEDVTVMMTAVPILAQLVYQVPIGRLALRFGGGGGLAIAYTSLSSTTLGSTTATQALPTASGLLGGELTVGRGRLGLEVAYWYSPLGAGAVTGNAGGLNVTLGYRFEP